MKKTLLTIYALITAMTLITGCGGGGGGDNPPAQPTQAILTLSTSGTLDAGTKIGGIDVTVTLPSGVTVKATPDSVNTSKFVTDAGVVTAAGDASGDNTNVIATYTAASGGAAGTVAIHIVNADGFGTGDFVTVNCDIAAGSHPKAEDFTTSDLSAVDLNGASITGLTAGLTADIK